MVPTNAWWMIENCAETLRQGVEFLSDLEFSLMVSSPELQATVEELKDVDGGLMAFGGVKKNGRSNEKMGVAK